MKLLRCSPTGSLALESRIWQSRFHFLHSPPPIALHVKDSRINGVTQGAIQGRQHQQLQGAGEKWKLQGSISDLLNQNSGSGAGNLSFLRPPRKVCAHQILRNTAREHMYGHPWIWCISARQAVCAFQETTNHYTVVLQSAQAAHPFAGVSSVSCRFHTGSRYGAGSSQ